MQTFDCTCGNRLFFDNTVCTQCGSALGFCPACRRISPLSIEGDTIQCGHDDCGAPLIKCHNYAVEQVCNRCVVALKETDRNASHFCDCCRYNQTIPDLSVQDNRSKWARLEAAKRRLFYQLDLLGLPRGRNGEGVQPPLAFDFKADVIGATDLWQNMGEERVYTGHKEGTITINIREVDDVERERLRVAFGERHRTLIGHFRHEIGHYYWAVLVQGKPCEAECIKVFGDHHAMDYGAAKTHYYENGPPADWSSRFTSAYASMHPWEDFAETFAFYLEIVSALDTAKNMSLGGPGVTDNLDRMIKAYTRIGMALNEMNRAMELKDFAVRQFNEPVIGKLAFVHGLVRAGETPSPQLTDVTSGPGHSSAPPSASPPSSP